MSAFPYVQLLEMTLDVASTEHPSSRPIKAYPSSYLYHSYCPPSSLFRNQLSSYTNLGLSFESEASNLSTPFSGCCCCCPVRCFSMLRVVSSTNCRPFRFSSLCVVFFCRWVRSFFTCLAVGRSVGFCFVCVCVLHEIVFFSLCKYGVSVRACVRACVCVCVRASVWSSMWCAGRKRPK